MQCRQLLVRCAILAPLALAACGKGDARPPAGSAVASVVAGDLRVAADPLPTAGNDSAGPATIRETLAEVTATVNEIQRAGAAEQRRLLPEHERKVNDMLERFGEKVRAMHAEVDPDWIAVIDSVQTDLARMPGMSDAELHAYIPGHTRRVMRIVACVDMIRGADD